MPEKLKSSCHCGAVTFEVARPEHVVSCNCSICRRYATLWTHCPPVEGAILTGSDQVTRYSWGDRTIEFCACRTCGCITHWVSGKDADQQRMALNLRMLSPSDLNTIPVRHFDGADSWTYLD